MIAVSDIVKSYGNSGSKTEVLKGISLQIADGDFTVILGASGSGKSTFLNVISGLERPDIGSIVYGNNDITKLSDSELTQFRRDNIGFIFQGAWNIESSWIFQHQNCKALLGIRFKRFYRMHFGICAGISLSADLL